VWRFAARARRSGSGLSLHSFSVSGERPQRTRYAANDALLWCCRAGERASAWFTYVKYVSRSLGCSHDGSGRPDGKSSIPIADHPEYETTPSDSLSRGVVLRGQVNEDLGVVFPRSSPLSRRGTSMYPGAGQAQASAIAAALRSASRRAFDHGISGQTHTAVTVLRPMACAGDSQRSNTAMDSTCAVCGNMSMTPALRSRKPSSFTRIPASRANVPG
jgi:hypothetical protein